MDIDKKIDAIARKLERLDEVLAEGAATLDKVPSRLKGMRERLEANLAPLEARMRNVEEIGKDAEDEIRECATQLNNEMDKLNDYVGQILSKARSNFPTDVSSAAVNELTTSVADTFRRAKSAIQKMAMQYADNLDLFEARIIAIDEGVVQMTEQIAARISGELEDLREAFESQFISPVRSETESFIDDLADDAVRHIVQPLETEAAELTDAIGDRLDALLEDLATQLRAFLDELKEALLRGDAEDQGTQAQVKEALDMLKDAIPPLEAAFESFAALADTVGLGV